MVDLSSVGVALPIVFIGFISLEFDFWYVLQLYDYTRTCTVQMLHEYTYMMYIDECMYQ